MYPKKDAYFLKIQKEKKNYKQIRYNYYNYLKQNKHKSLNEFNLDNIKINDNKSVTSKNFNQVENDEEEFIDDQQQNERFNKTITDYNIYKQNYHLKNDNDIDKNVTNNNLYNSFYNFNQKDQAKFSLNYANYMNKKCNKINEINDQYKKKSYLQILNKQVQDKKDKENREKQDNQIYHQTLLNNIQLYDQHENQINEKYQNKLRNHFKIRDQLNEAKQMDKNYDQHIKEQENQHFVQQIKKDLKDEKLLYENKKKTTLQFLEDSKKQAINDKNKKIYKKIQELENDHNYQKHYVDNIIIQNAQEQQKLKERLIANSKSNPINEKILNQRKEYLENYERKMDKYMLQQEYLQQKKDFQFQQQKKQEALETKQFLFKQMQEKQDKQQKEFEKDQKFAQTVVQDSKIYDQYIDDEKNQRKNMNYHYGKHLQDQIQFNSIKIEDRKDLLDLQKQYLDQNLEKEIKQYKNEFYT